MKSIFEELSPCEKIQLYTYRTYLTVDAHLLTFDSLDFNYKKILNHCHSTA